LNEKINSIKNKLKGAENEKANILHDDGCMFNGM
jgi:hypothetical protein